MNKSLIYSWWKTIRRSTLDHLYLQRGQNFNKCYITPPSVLMCIFLLPFTMSTIFVMEISYLPTDSDRSSSFLFNTVFTHRPKVPGRHFLHPIVCVPVSLHVYVPNTSKFSLYHTLISLVFFIGNFRLNLI